MLLHHILEFVSHRTVYQKIYGTKNVEICFLVVHIFVIPVDGEEEVVDADGDGVPGGGHVTSTGRGGGIIAMNRTLSQV